ncbi:hypothetical protein G647_02265 [Cladophialophora carrionii CBS 160.54]|uniref:Mid2 domain-containing protein n=1 Tax=Cladophialophora carrionii CBS 160.54 TaxID=1279043 RepID=V9DHR6_9EURO|nr:uncharacterized protein G647_02265 [Cladophialophora carrionii CBS 160.54]ETI25492.1 hypothetical protein G647_02265 [Cladophialophora carrionii CBS 160.54]
MFQESFRQHGKRAPQRHQRPESDSDAAAQTPTPPSTTADMTTPTTSAATTAGPDTATDMPHALFVYPTLSMTLNNIDEVQLGYRSVWGSVNLTVFCEMGEASNEFSLARMNKLQSNGTYAIAPIQAGMQIPHFPTYCNFMLCDAENSTDYTTGAGFTMISTKGIATTYALAVTQAATTSPSGVNSPISTVSHTESTLTGAAAVTSSTAVQTAVPSSSHSDVLSSGAKAGIAIGVILGVALIVAAFCFIRIKRRIDKLETMVTLRSTASSVDRTPSEKGTTAGVVATPTAVAASPSPPPDGCGPRIEVFKIGDSHRNSEDWRRFFGNGKAPKPVAPS